MPGKSDWKKLAEKLQAEFEDNIKRINHLPKYKAEPAPASIFKKTKYHFFKTNPYRARNIKLAHVIWHDTTDEHKDRCVDRLISDLQGEVKCSRLRALEFFAWRRTPSRSKPAKRAMAKLAARRGRRG